MNVQLEDINMVVKVVHLPVSFSVTSLTYMYFTFPLQSKNSESR